MMQQRQILEAQIVSRTAVNPERQAARLRAKAAVAASAAEYRAQQALAGYAHAQRAVYEHFDFEVCRIADLPQFCAFELARHDHASKSHFPQQPHAGRRLDGSLRRSMQRDVAACARDPRRAHVLNNQRVHVGAYRRTQRAAQFVRLRVRNERIERQI